MAGKRKYIIDKEQIEQLYIAQRLSLRKVAVYFGVDFKTIRHRLVEYEIPVRGQNEAQQGNKNGIGHVGWNRGLTKEDHPSIRSMAEKLTGQVGSRLGKKASPETKRRLSEAKRKSGIKPDTTAANIRTRQLWADPEWKAMMLKKLRSAFQKKPNTLEQELITLFAENEMPYEFAGDGKIVINGLIPDFINVNGEKKVIELFGEYWHGRQDIKWHQTELGRMMAYNSVGFDCLIIWDKELKDKVKVLQKLKAFDRKRR